MECLFFDFFGLIALFGGLFGQIVPSGVDERYKFGVFPAMATNRSYDTDGLDDPTRDWLQRVVRVINHPEWGAARVLRWYPSAGGQAQMLRIKAQNNPAPQLVSILDVEVISES